MPKNLLRISGGDYTYTRFGDVIEYTSKDINYEKVDVIENVAVLNDNLTLDEVVDMVNDLRWQEERLEKE